MTLPVVAIVGRPNVGKSSLFNAIAGRRTSIVEPTAGVTRDRVTAICDIDEAYFELIDTGGHGIVDRDDLDEHVERQIRCAIGQADLILFVVDAREGLAPLDRATGDLLRKHHQVDRVRLLANKVDEPHMDVGIGEFGRLGFGDALAVSAVTGVGREELYELIREAVGGAGEEAPPDPVMKIAIVGKRNAGKSSFINALAGEERVIVSEIPGTTRDSIDVRFEKDGRTIVAIDTAGVRKKRKIADDIEFYAYSRVTQSIQRADVVLFLIDATLPVGQVDKRLASLVSAEYKPCILVINKWDLAKGRAGSEDYGAYLTAVLPQVSYAPVAFTSAVTGRNTYATIDLAAELFKQARTRVGTGRLNQALQEALAGTAPKTKRGRKPPKFYYATQVSTQPPTLVLFVNGPSLVTKDYERYLINRFRETLPFPEIPIRLVFRARRERAAT
jgi:GTP-binding protein